ncbi:MAG: hypothetical protein OXF26_02335 [Alphaproteobacteria bacterium]|nr:hypothetical protein [Alphaproteobacteria bacterium]MCY4318958.1 hypothetical protein [Alphaproteobacteria bacterium]
MSTRTTAFWCVSAAAMAAGLFTVSDHVRDHKEQLAELNQLVLAERERIQVLRSELAYLTQPQTLEIQNARALSLVPIEADQLHRSSFLPARTANAPEPPRNRVRAGRDGDSISGLPTETPSRLSFSPSAEEWR